MSKRQIRLITLCAAIILFFLGIFFYQKTDVQQPKVTASPTPTVASTVKPFNTPSVTRLSVPTAQPQRSLQPVPYEGKFELPIQGATGYATVDLNLRSGPSVSSQKIGTFPSGSGFRILREEGNYWYVTNGQQSGYVAHQYCMINLPDIIPSIVYDNTNSYDAKLLSSGKVLPGITGEGLYDNMTYNKRLGKDEFIMPVLYEMASRICAAQQAALAQGDSLKIYEAYRPYQVQRKVVDALAALAEQDDDVKAGISTPPWKVSWFAAQGISNHQRGCAIDVSLVKVNRLEERTCGPYSYSTVTDYTEYKMPTEIHELSIAAAAFGQPVSSTSTTAWKNVAPARTMNEAARALQKYCTDAGLTPLASEWWHFNDLNAYNRIQSNPGAGEFVLTAVYSIAPEIIQK